MADLQNNNDTVLANVNSTKERLGTDAFFVKIERRARLVDVQFMFATFRNVTLNQLADIETWLPQLGGGGGIYDVRIYHEQETSKSLGSMKFHIPGPVAKERASRDVVADPNWSGPREITYPNHEASKPETLGTGLSAPQGAAILTQAAQVTAKEESMSRVEFLNIMALRDKDAENARLRAEIARPIPQDSNKEMIAMMMQFFSKAAEVQQKTDERMTQLMIEMNKPKPPDALTQKMIEKALSEDKSPDKNIDRFAKFMEAQAASMTTVLGATVQLMTTKVELENLQRGEPESPVYRLVGRALDIFQQAKVDGTDVDETKALPEGEASDTEEESISALQALEGLIRSMRPASELTPVLFEALADEEFQKLWTKHKGNVEALITERLGGWVMEDYKAREVYIRVELVKALNAAVAVGLIKVEQPRPVTHSSPAPIPNGKKNGARMKAVPPPPPSMPNDIEKPVSDAPVA